MRNEEEVNLLFPPWELFRRFLLVTMMLMLGTGFSFGIIVNYYVPVPPKWGVGILFLVSMVFFAINFSVTRGAFLCAKILKYYALSLACISTPSLLMGVNIIFLVINIILTLGAFFLISGSTYQKLVQYQFNFFEDIKKSRESVEKELAKSRERS